MVSRLALLCSLLSLALVVSLYGARPSQAGAFAPAPRLTGCSLTNSADISSGGSGTWTRCTWDTELDDPDGYHDTGSNTGRITIPSGKGGRYLLTANVPLQAVIDAARQTYTRFYKNGSYLANSPVTFASMQTISSTWCTTHTPTCVVNLAAGDYVETWFMMNDSGVSSKMMSSSDTANRAQFTAVKLN